jgi:hypothetical protein
MKKEKFFTLLFIFVLSNYTKVFTQNFQENKVKSKFDFKIIGSFGNGIMENSNLSNYIVTSNSLDLFVNFNINNKFGIASGIGYIYVNGNFDLNDGYVFHNRNYIKIPILLTYELPLSDKLSIVSNFGFYTSKIVKDEYTSNENVYTNFYTNWSFGMQLGLGFVHKINDNFSAGFNYLGFSDLNSQKSNNTLIFDNNQKLKNINSFGFIVSLTY